MQRMALSVMGLVLLSGCSAGLQEVGFAIPDSKDGVHHIVTRDVVSARFTANQPHTAGQFHCTGKYTSVEMASLRAQYGEHTWYKGCTPTVDLVAHKYSLTSDQSIGSLLQGPVSAAILGGAIGAGLAFSGDDSTTNVQGGNASATGGAGGKGVGYGGAGGKGGSVTNKIYKKW